MNPWWWLLIGFGVGVFWCVVAIVLAIVLGPWTKRAREAAEAIDERRDR